MKPNRILPFATLVALLSAPIALGQDKAGAPEKIGQVRFPVSCSPAAQQEFDRAVALLASFWFDAGSHAFGVVTQMDPGCSIRAMHWRPSRPGMFWKGAGGQTWRR